MSHAILSRTAHCEFAGRTDVPASRHMPSLPSRTDSPGQRGWHVTLWTVTSIAMGAIHSTTWTLPQASLARALIFSAATTQSTCHNAAATEGVEASQPMDIRFLWYLAV